MLTQDWDDDIDDIYEESQCAFEACKSFLCS